MGPISNTLIYWTFLTIVAVIDILFIYWTYRAYKRKTKLQFWTRVIVLGGIHFFFLFVNELIPGSSIYYDYRYTKRVTGHSMQLQDIYTYESYREPLLGDGYSMYVYSFDEASTKYFQRPNRAFFTDYPFDLAEVSDWKRLNWTECPIYECDSIFWKFALNQQSNSENLPLTKLDKAELLVGDLLNDEGNYYAYSANVQSSDGWGDLVMNISFYVLSPKKGWLVAIYSDM